MPPSFTLGAGVLSAAVTALTNADTALGTVIAGVAGPTTTVVAPGADTVSIAQAAAVDAWASTLQTALANGQSYASQFITNLSNASDTYNFAEAANAASATASAAASPGDGGILTTISQLLGGPSGSLNGMPFSLSSNTANIGNIGAGNWASAMSDLLGMAGGGLLPAGSDTIGDAGVAAALASDTTPVGVGMGGMGGFGGMPMGGMGGGTLVGKMSVPPSWGGTVTPVTGTMTSPLRTVGWTGAAPEATSGGFIPGMPGMGGAGRSAAGFGAPRYGVKPIVMPKPATV
jgi:hypothetical protein